MPLATAEDPLNEPGLAIWPSAYMKTLELPPASLAMPVTTPLALIARALE